MHYATDIANRVTDKITPLSERVFICRSGSAADTQNLSRYVQWFLQQHGMELGEEPEVKVAAKLAQMMAYQNKNALQAGLIVAGWDRHGGGSVYAIPLGGTLVKTPFSIGGSGSAYINGLCDKLWRVRACVRGAAWEGGMGGGQQARGASPPQTCAAQTATCVWECLRTSPTYPAASPLAYCYRYPLPPCLCPPPLPPPAAPHPTHPPPPPHPTHPPLTRTPTAQHDRGGVPRVCGQGRVPRHGPRRLQRRLHPHRDDQQGRRQAHLHARQPGAGRLRRGRAAVAAAAAGAGMRGHGLPVCSPLIAYVPTV